MRNAGPFVFSESPILKIIEKILGGHCFWRPCPHIYMFVCHIYNWNLLKYPCFEWSERAFFCRVVCSLQHKGDSQVSGNYIIHICIYIYILYIYSWNLKHLFTNGCFNWMIPSLYIGNDWKSPFPSTLNWFFRLPGIYIYIHI